MSDNEAMPQQLVDAACAGVATFERDRAIYAVVSQHGFRPIKWQITPEEAAELAKRFAEMFRIPVLVDAETEQREREAEQHAPLFRAIRQSGQR
jgi:hypothetical protein